MFRAAPKTKSSGAFCCLQTRTSSPRCRACAFVRWRPTRTQKRGREQVKTDRGRGRKAEERQQLAAPLTPAIEGRLTMTRQGYGFVNVYDGSSDVFIPPDAVGPALHGDTVQLRARPSSKGREGHIVGIVERRLKNVDRNAAPARPGDELRARRRAAALARCAW